MIENKSTTTNNNNVRKRINFDEPIPDMIDRLISEHRNFEIKLQEAENVIISIKDSSYATKIMSMSESITHHAVEEEARLLRVIMHKAKDESSESINFLLISQ